MNFLQSENKRIIQSFIIVSAFLVGLGIYTILKINELSDITVQFFEHPLKVTNATREVQRDITAIDHYLSDIVLAENDKELEEALINIQKYEVRVYEHFDLIRSKYLGSPKEVLDSYALFKAWAPIIDEIIALKKEDEIKQAILLIKTKGQKHHEKLNTSVDILADYAYAKAETFVSDARKTKKDSILITLVIIITLLVFVGIVLYLLLRYLHKIEKIRHEQEEHLISQSKLAQAGEMMSMIAHQWRQPLSAIASVALNIKIHIELDADELVNDEGRAKHISFLNDSLKDIESFTQDLTKTIDEFRDFYKKDKTYKVLGIETVIEKSMHIINHTFNLHGINIIVMNNSTKQLQMIEGEIIQVFLNLFQNSIDAFSSNCIQSPSIKITTQDLEDGVCIEVKDNAGGINKEILKKIFTPYFSTKTSKNGTGLGLYMSQVILQKHHNGKLEVDSVDEEAIFSVYLRDVI